jgi:hypothetical protein
MQRLSFTALAAGLLVTGCATMSPEQCMVADWYRLGEQDAMAGRSPDHLANRAGACQEAGYEADAEAWYAGFEEALPRFCTLDNGFQFGVSGSRYQNTCPAYLSEGFQSGYQVGAEIYALEQSVAAAQRRVDQADQRIERELNREQPDPDRIEDLQDELDDLVSDLRELELELATARGVAIGQGFRLPR